MNFPDALKGKYQCFTQADLTKLREAGSTEPFLTVEQGVGRYIEWLEVDRNSWLIPFRLYITSSIAANFERVARDLN